MDAISDEEIIRRKLIVEGDSGNDDKRMNILLKSFVRFSQFDPSSDKRLDFYNSLICIMLQCKQAMVHNLFVYEANIDQQKVYAELSKDIDNKIALAQQKINVCHENLLNAKKIRKNRIEYNNLAKIILQHPSRAQSTLKLKEINSKLKLLQTENEAMDKKIELRKKQFRLFLVALKDLKSTIIESDADSHHKNGSSSLESSVEIMDIS